MAFESLKTTALLRKQSMGDYLVEFAGILSLGHTKISYEVLGIIYMSLEIRELFFNGLCVSSLKTREYTCG